MNNDYHFANSTPKS